MIFDTPNLPLPLRMKADLCIVGSGAGGSAVATSAAEEGVKVLVLEAGELLTPADMSQREEDMFARLYWESGGRANRDRSVRIHQGRGVGGSTLHNLNLCKRIPEGLLGQWLSRGRLDHLPLEVWRRLYEDVESYLGVSLVERERWTRHNLLLEQGCQKLGWRGGGMKHNRNEGCTGSGYCEVGCAYDGKNNGAKVMIPRAVSHGAQVLTLCQAVRLRHDGKRVLGVDAVALDPLTRHPVGEVYIEAERVCLSASATGTAALLLRSKVPDPSATTGRGLRVHPAVVVAGRFAEPVEAWKGLPQTYECTEWLDLDREDGPRLWIVPAFAHPVGTATMIPGHGEAHRSLMGAYAHTAVLTGMIHDLTAGVVSPRGDLGVDIDYYPDERDLVELRRGLWACAKLLLAAGAEEVMVPGRRPITLRPGDDPEPLLSQPLLPGDVPLTAVHPMSSVPMDDDPARAAVSSEGHHHHLGGLWIADGSLFPTSIGGPPQLSIYAMGLHVGRSLVRGG